MNEYSAILKFEYDIEIKNIYPVIGGWSALAYKVESEQSVYFLKVYEKHKCGTAMQLEKLSLCMEIASWLNSNTGLKNKINAPLLTKQGNIKAETQNYRFPNERRVRK